jgi:hypothetical protein
MTTDFCDRPLAENEVIMNELVYKSQERRIIVKRDDVELNPSNSYIPGEVLIVTLSEGVQGSQHVFETSPNAMFILGGCDGLRSASDIAELKTSKELTGVYQPIVLKAGMISKRFYFR